jgi:hypothetical protein
MNTYRITWSARGIGGGLEIQANTNEEALQKWQAMPDAEVFKDADYDNIEYHDVSLGSNWQVDDGRPYVEPPPVTYRRYKCGDLDLFIDNRWEDEELETADRSEWRGSWLDSGPDTAAGLWLEMVLSLHRLTGVFSASLWRDRRSDDGGDTRVDYACHNFEITTEKAIDLLRCDPRSEARGILTAQIAAVKALPNDVKNCA